MIVYTLNLYYGTRRIVELLGQTEGPKYAITIIIVIGPTNFWIRIPKT